MVCTILLRMKVHGEWLPWIATFTYGGSYHLTRHLPAVSAKGTIEFHFMWPTRIMATSPSSRNVSLTKQNGTKVHITCSRQHCSTANCTCMEGIILYQTYGYLQHKFCYTYNISYSLCKGHPLHILF